MGICTDGTVMLAGYRGDGQYEAEVSNWSDIVAVASDSYHHMVGLRADGTVVAVGYNENGECEVSGWKNIKLPDGQ